MSLGTGLVFFAVAAGLLLTLWFVRPEPDARYTAAAPKPRGDGKKRGGNQLYK